MTKHTPSPWTATLMNEGKKGENSLWEHWRIGNREADNSIVAECSVVAQCSDYKPENGKEERDANAQLIAAAPELLEALLWLVNLHNGVGKDGHTPTNNEWSNALENGVKVIDEAVLD